jgi:hypothetical protein
MPLISLRQFRDRIQTISQPVEVALREPDGHLRVLGTWTPIPPPILPPGLGIKGTVVREHQAVVEGKPVRVIDELHLESVGFRPAPKPTRAAKPARRGRS